MNTATYEQMARKPRILAVGERVMCGCGDEQCFRAIEIGIDMLVVYRDVSDRYEEWIVVDLPPGYALVKYE